MHPLGKVVKEFQNSSVVFMLSLCRIYGGSWQRLKCFYFCQRETPFFFVILARVFLSFAISRSNSLILLSQLSTHILRLRRLLSIHTFRPSLAAIVSFKDSIYTLTGEFSATGIDMESILCPEDFSAILDELRRRPITINKYRNSAGEGRSQAFGVVGRRCLDPDYSRNSWQRPYLYKLLLDFGEKHVKIPFTSITINDNYKAGPHRDKGNVGQSYLVGFGDYQKGELQLHEGDLSGCHDIRYRPLVTDFSSALHSVQPWTGQRYSLVYYFAKGSELLPPASVKLIDGKWKFFRGAEQCDGLPHPLKGRTK